MTRLMALMFAGLTAGAGALTMTHVEKQSPEISVREDSSGHRPVGPGFHYGK